MMMPQQSGRESDGGSVSGDTRCDGIARVHGEERQPLLDSR